MRARRAFFLQSNALPLWESPFPVLNLDYQEKILVCISPLGIVTLVKICYGYSCFLLIPFLLRGHSFSLCLHFAMCLELGFVTSENVVSGVCQPEDAYQWAFGSQLNRLSSET